VTKGAARGHLGWARRVLAHPQVAAALAEGTVLTESMARTICGWTDKVPRECRPAADDILVAAAQAGARREDLAALAAEIYARSLPDPEDDPGHGGGLLVLTGPGQRTGHRRQRLRPPVRVGNGPGHPPHARRSSTAADAPRCSRDLNRRDHARVVEGPPAPGLATAGPEDRTEITGPANPVAPMNW
jgi:hypothetical protein